MCSRIHLASAWSTHTAFLLVLAAFIFLRSQAGAQQYSGTFIGASDVGGVMTLLLQESGPETVIGRLSSNEGSYQLDGRVENGLLVGSMRGIYGAFYFEVERRDYEVWLTQYGIDAEGEPDYGDYTELYFTEQGFEGGASGAVGGSRGGNPLDGNWPPAGGNPLVGAGLDPYVGTFTDGNVTLQLQGGGGQYQGQVVVRGAVYQIQAQLEANGIEGLVESPDGAFQWSAYARDGGLIVVSGGTQYTLMRQGYFGSSGGFGQVGGFGSAGAFGSVGPFGPGGATWGVRPGLPGYGGGSREYGGGARRGFTENHPDVRDWMTLLAGQKLTRLSTFSTGGAGGYNSRVDLYLCSDRSFAMHQESSQSLDVRARRGNFAEVDGGQGEWYVTTNGYVVLLILLFDYGRVQEFRMDYHNPEIYANGERVHLTPTDICF